MVEAPPAPRTKRFGPAGESVPDPLDFLGLEIFSHLNKSLRGFLPVTREPGPSETGFQRGPTP